MNIGGQHLIVLGPPGAGGRARARPAVERVRKDAGQGPRAISAYLLIDGEPAGGFESQLGFFSFISWSGLDIGRDRGSPVSHYEAPFTFTGNAQGHG